MIDPDEAIRLRQSWAAAARLDRLQWFESLAKRPQAEVRQIMETARSAFGELLAHSTCFLWDPEKWRTATAGSELFRDHELTADEIVLPWRDRHLWIFDPPLALDQAGKEGSSTRAILLGPGQVMKNPSLEEGWVAFESQYGLLCRVLLEPDEPGDADRVIVLESVMKGTVVGGGFWGIVMSALHFLNNDIVGSDPLPLPRQSRRMFERAEEEPPEVRAIVFRRLRRRDPASPGGPGPTVQFLVGWPDGFWRRQWYPSSQERRPKWIAPFIKGPPGAPFKGPSEAVGLVTR